MEHFVEQESIHGKVFQATLRHTHWTMVVSNANLLKASLVAVSAVLENFRAAVGLQLILYQALTAFGR